MGSFGTASTWVDAKSHPEQNPPSPNLPASGRPPGQGDQARPTRLLDLSHSPSTRR
ncbi:MAG: hypothetical protein LBE07_09545 [Gordonia sp. (in: high G+C Gram-positive bacteria)]|nr:hypothetical protein [Gordonia sp. (in: high G+C Gram-positive bacteria)]